MADPERPRPLRLLLILACVVGLAAGAWLVLRDDGVLEQVTASRIEQALLDNRVPAPMAECMAPELADRLSISQLRKLERLKAQGDESRDPLSTGQAMTRLRHLDDRQMVEQIVLVTGGCGFDLMVKGL